MKYIIEHHFAYGWDILNEEDVYPTEAKTQEAIDDLIANTKEAFEKGDMDQAYDPEDFRVVKHYEESKGEQS
tara:strand:- start:5691 stop:5906 length:216 start_codon:yes stop_codon:yes gene_type:complete